MTEVIALNGSSSSSDWQDRYYHVDQVLDRPGPRTDESFSPGDAVRASCFEIRVVLNALLYHL